MCSVYMKTVCLRVMAVASMTSICKWHMIQQLCHVNNSRQFLAKVWRVRFSQASQTQNDYDLELESTRHRKKPHIGSRYLLDKSKLFEFNAWDNVKWDPEQVSLAEQKVQENSSEYTSAEDTAKYEENASKMWDEFYGVHQNRFFKDRQWIFTEFPEIAPSNTSAYVSVHSSSPDSEKSCEDVQEQDMKILEVGCGVGNSVIPIIKTNNNPRLMVYACDFSSTAVELLRQDPAYDKDRCCAFVCDVTAEDWNPPFPANSLDVAILIFTLSAISPDKTRHVARQLFQYLKPGGLVVFRDYGRYDLVQLRFKKGRCISDHFYARSDGTRVYFFTQDELRSIFTSQGFEEKQNLMDKRLQVNRRKQMAMYRVWVQAKYQKPATPTPVISSE